MTAIPDIPVNSHPTARVAHDFNNLLTVILTGLCSARAQLSQKLDPDDAIFTELGDVMTAARAAVELTARLTAVGCHNKPDLVELSPNSLLREMAPLIRNAMSRGVEVTWNLAPHLPDILVDRTHFQRVILNLAVNANAAMPHGGDLNISTSVDPSSEDMVRLAVSDNGNGMSTDTVNRIFEPFYTTRPTRGGTGLGLAIVNTIVRDLRGTIHVETALGHGTTFEIAFPTTPPRRNSARPH